MPVTFPFRIDITRYDKCTLTISKYKSRHEILTEIFLEIHGEEANTAERRNSLNYLEIMPSKLVAELTNATRRRSNVCTDVRRVKWQRSKQDDKLKFVRTRKLIGAPCYFAKY